MKISTLPLLALVISSIVPLSLPAQSSSKGPSISVPPLSPPATLKQRVGFTDVEVVYARPSLRGRKMFGAWERYGEVWRTGANAATKITFSTAVRFGGKELPAGTYALFSIPGPSEWTVIFNKASGEWGAYTYKQENDVLRVTAKPVALPQPVETFTIDINDIKTESATLNLIWERVRVPVPFQFDVINKVNEQIEAAMQSGQPLDAGAYFSAAVFYLENGLDLNKARTWIDEATKGENPRFFMLYHKARILAKLGDKAGATAAAKQSMAAAQKQGGPVAVEYTRRNEELLATLK